MAYQHFYSRVPARVSLFKKTDGFDTFAHSAELDSGFIERDLAPLYENKLPKGDLVRIRRGEIPTIYSQTVLRSGRTVQSALTYLPLDYTGERSAYLVHNLVLTDEERSMLFANKSASSFNPNMFITNIAAFNITSPSATPNRAYPEKKYIAPALADTKKLVLRYDAEMVRSFLHAVLFSVCGRGKNIYFRLPYDNRRISAAALDFINAILTVLPYNLRELLSFVTYVSDINQFPQVKLKCVSSEIEQVPPIKGIFFDFESGLITGMPDDADINGPLISFFYSLLENIELRDSFHNYVANILFKYQPRALTMKMLNEVVFLFWQCSGFYLEDSVLPNDSVVYEFLSVYEKYRDALPTAYRMNAYKCLERYPREHTAIPKNIFSKFSRLYPDDVPEAKRVALNVVLRLIHTEIMREKLFNFIKNNYDAESKEVKAVINDDLCRVFYGGFLQSELLDFFNENFMDEPVHTRDAVLGKLLLTIRTDSVQEKIVSFLDNHYSDLTPEQKSNVYSTYFEMLPECDKLTVLLVDLINRHITVESAEFKASVAGKLSEFVVANYKNTEHNLLPILSEKAGFSDDVVTKLVFSENGGVAYSDYVAILKTLPAEKKAARLINVFSSVIGIGDAVYVKLLHDSRSAFNASFETTMYDMISADKAAAATIPTHLLTPFRECVIYPAIIHTLYDVFKVRYGKEGIGVILKYAEDKPFVSSSEQYAVIEEYIKFTRCANSEDAVGAFESISKLPKVLRVRRDIAEHIRMCSLNRSTQSYKTAFIYELVINFLRDSSFRFDVVYTQYKNSFAQDYNVKLGVKANADKVSHDSTLRAATLLVETVMDMCRADESFISAVSSDDSGFGRAIQSFLLTFGGGAAKFLGTHIEDAPAQIREVIELRIKQCKPQGNNIFARLFRRK